MTHTREQLSFLCKGKQSSKAKESLKTDEGLGWSCLDRSERLECCVNTAPMFMMMMMMMPRSQNMSITTPVRLHGGVFFVCVYPIPHPRGESKLYRIQTDAPREKFRMNTPSRT